MRTLTLVRRVAPLILLLVVLAVLTVRAAEQLDNQDTYFHLRFGHELLGEWSLRDPGSVSSFATADWVPTQWLPQITMAAVEDRAGLAGVAWLSGLAFLALALTLYVVARRRVEPLAAAPLTALALVASSSGLSARPQVLSYLLVAVTATAWLAAARSGRTPWWLVPLTWVWACCHGMWPVGLAIGGVAVLATALRPDRRWDRVARGAAVVALSGLATLVTPVGPRLLGAVVAVDERREFFSEWGRPDPGDPRLLALLALLLVAAAALAWRGTDGPRGPRTLRGLRESPDLTALGLLVLAGGCTVASGRTVPVAAALLVPVAATALHRHLGDRPAWTRLEQVVVLGGVALALPVLAAVVPHTADEPPARPAWTDPALAALPAGTPVLNDWNLGGWLMWRHPQLDPVMHGYGDTFTVEELRRNTDILALRPGWRTLVRETGVSYALVRPRSPLGRALVDDEGWRVLHRSPDLVLLKPPPGWM
ncbi:hypothetical protein [Nocardioides sp. W7]|uniref:hypothetical protein n=1 Tax=Nocardioides sp. W7 TaxID=2931390 RepID=UPI001FCF8E2C|nr:hypothetical protein [Nocardioides sp. W7]